MKKSMWIVVADGTIARIHSWAKASEVPVLVEELAHPEGRLHSSELVSDRPGQAQSDGGQPHGLAQRESAAEHERERFAHRIATVIDAGLAKNRFTELALVMAPKMLGLVRERLSTPARRAIVGTIDHRLVDVPIDDVVRQLSAVIGPEPLA